MKEINSEISGFYKLSIDERQKIIVESCNLNTNDQKLLQEQGVFFNREVEQSIENVITSFQLPLGIATNFRVNNRDYLIPMVIEESSVVAAASNAAKIARKQGGFTSKKMKSIMISQIQITKLSEIEKAITKLLKKKEQIIQLANAQDPTLVELGGGVINIELKQINTARGKMLILHLLVDVRDAMGANIVNTMAEAITPLIEEITGGHLSLRIVSNLAIYRLAESSATFDKELLGGENVVDAILDAYEFALVDPFRCATHNKGIMNGIIAVAQATGNDTRALEAGAHAFAALNKTYSPLTKFEKDEKGNLIGSIILPLAMGVMGGMTSVHPMAHLAIKILGVNSANELGQVVAAVGLAQNVAALRALVSEGIQEGHMALHSRKIVKLAGIPDEYSDVVANKIVKDKKIRVDHAKKVYNDLRKKN